MIKFVKFKGATIIPVGHWHLVYDDDDGDWSLWHGERSQDRFVINWWGALPAMTGEQELYDKGWDDGFFHRRITKAQADQCVMAAMALTSEGWYRFAKRLVEGETS